jgi:hypothetical protein
MKKMNQGERGLFRFLFWVARRETLSMSWISKTLQRAFRNINQGRITDEEANALSEEAVSLLVAGDHQAARDRFSDLTRKAPWLAEAYAGLATAELTLNHPHQSLLASSLGIVIAEGQPDLIYLSAEALRRLGQDEMAAQGYQLILKKTLEPKYEYLRVECERRLAALAESAADAGTAQAAYSA